MLNLGDITKINGAEHPIPSVVIGGSPCQDLSVAGKRAGLAGERSGLFMEQIRVIKEMRSVGRTDDDGHILPRWMVWENVPGALSSQGGEDFRAVLEETCWVADETAVIPRPPKGKWTAAGAVVGNGYSVAWRIHDAQYWGVPQRRRRIALVADFGAGTAAELLFEKVLAESESLSGDIDAGGAERQRAAGDATQGADETSPITGRCFPLEGNGSRPSHHGDGYSEEDVSYTLNAVEQHAVAYGMDRASYNQGQNAKYDFTITEEVMPTMVSKGPNAVYAVENHPSDSRVTLSDDGVVQTLSSRMGTGGNNTPFCMVSSWDGTDVSHTLTARNAGGGQRMPDKDNFTAVLDNVVRRLTPRECERLQGYPDGWTDIGEWTDSKGKRHKEADSPRYKALGNSIALPFWQFLLNRIAAECKEKTMVSLFDGIGGFPLCWKRAGGETLWVSEIEEFCIAVTRKRFEEEETK